MTRTIAIVYRLYITRCNQYDGTLMVQVMWSSSDCVCFKISAVKRSTVLESCFLSSAPSLYFHVSRAGIEIDQMIKDQGSTQWYALIPCIVCRAHQLSSAGLLLSLFFAIHIAPLE
jgi:hypothetical protein